MVEGQWVRRIDKGFVRARFFGQKTGKMCIVAGGKGGWDVEPGVGAGYQQLRQRAGGGSLDRRPFHLRQDGQSPPGGYVANGVPQYQNKMDVLQHVAE